MKVKDKIILNKTLYQIRSLSDIERQKLGIFLKENIEKTVSFIATELFTYIYGRLPQNHVFYPLKIKNDLTFMLNNLKQYGIKGHYEFIPDKAQQIEYNKYSQLHRTAVLLAEMPAHEFDDYLRRMQASADAIPDIAEATSKWYLQNRNDLMKCRRLYVIGYDNCLADMMEGTLKICEAVRYSVQGFELEEFMHGIYHCIDEDTYMLYVCSKGQYYDRILRLKRYFEEERHSHNFLITHENTNNSKDLVFPFTDDQEFAVLQYIVPMQVLARKLSLDLGIDCNIPSDPQFHFKMNSYLKEG